MKQMLAVLMLFPMLLWSQNVGIGTNNPTEKLQVNGMIYTSQGGIKFPDNSVQTTAAFNNSGTNLFVGDIIMTINGPGQDFKGIINQFGIMDGINLLNQEDLLERSIISTQGGINLGKMELKEYSIIKPIDNTSAGFFKAMASGTLIPEVIIYYIKPGLPGTTTKNRLIQAVRLNDVYIARQNQLSKVDYESIEEITFFVTKICKSSYKAAVSGPDDVLTFGFDFLSNQVASCPVIPN